MERNIENEAKLIIENFPRVISEKDPYKVLVQTILSQRTKDVNTIKASLNLFSKYTNVFEISKLSPQDIYDLIKPAGMYKQKSQRIIELSKIIVHEYSGKVPNTLEDLLNLPGVGRKTANIVLNVSFGIAALAVDTHVHRISNRLGWVKTKTPEKTEFELMKILPKKLWGPINGSMVNFGQEICRPISPKCSLCLLRKFCPSRKIR
ncbi:endonuclease III [Petrotoga sp. 9PW.55.5.1]|uniref:endonuclease III domain-containing protein n=1 Tax=Petrotoga sp. 9PW.55.5.1 TaxID=1308979 RepID=UPI000DC3B83D|nr:endonuclease III [Petrotoga sp. 9PW.55.5.1]RAO98897.1 endonuclease III [Petrotoga sp. 9PW.55.5.1]